MRTMTKLELYLLMAFLFVLPLLEGPKNLFLVAYIVIWSVQSYKQKDFGGRLKVWEATLLLFIFAGIISSFTNPFGWQKSISGVLTFTKLIIPALMLSRTVVKSHESNMLAVSIIMGSGIAVLDSWAVWMSNGAMYPELKSVGHVNQSALYINLAFGVSIALAILRTGWTRWIFTGCVVFFAIAMIPTRSLTSLAVMFVMAVMALMLTFKANFKFIAYSAVAILLMASSINYVSKNLPSAQEFRSEIQYRAQGGGNGKDYTSARGVIFNSVTFSLEDFPWFGAGDRHFSEATSREYLEKIASNRNIEYNDSQFFHTNHGHNFVASILMNRGYIGLVFILSFLILTALKHLQWLMLFFSNRHFALEPIMGLMSGIYVIVGGVGNSTLYVEHGQLAFCLIGLSMGWLQRLHDDSRKVISESTYSVHEVKREDKMLEKEI